ncbi:MAG: cysteine desulfurase family protein [Nanoarchaeota archaeon]|nr:cysteine desulfurase family protein [Nanoarchaeota archaeon]
MKEIYLDNAATTPVVKLVKKEMDKYFSKEFGNPGSFNSFGLRAKKALDKARNEVAKILNAKPEEIIFTGSGTESINLALQGIARANKGKHIITSQIEHPSVLETCKFLETQGYEITYIKVDKYGILSLEELKKSIREDTILISIMYANNEIGSIQPIKEAAEIAARNKIYFHTDACQASGALDLDISVLGVDLMTLNGSKIYGPKGVGILFIKKGTRIKPLIFGGGQEFGLRSGTENVPNIIGFAKALQIAQQNQAKENKRLIFLRDKLITGLLSIDETILNGHPTKRLPNNANVAFLNAEGESILAHLNEKGICAASGSACSSKDLKASHVITATGYPPEVAHGSIRFTLGRMTKSKDLKKLLSVLPQIIKNLRQISPLNLKKEQILK